MIRTIPLKIQNEYITGDKGMIGAAGSHNDVILRMEFSGMWDGLTKMVQFRDALGEATIEVLLTADMLEADDTSVYLVPVPNGAKKYAGEMTLCIKGAAVSAQKETRATLAVYGRFTVAESKWSAEAETEADVPASNVEQLQGQIDNVLATIVDARKASTEAAKSEAAAKNAAETAAVILRATQNSAQNASESAKAAEKSAQDASQKYTFASAAANDAATFAQRAANSATAAKDSEDAAAGSASNAAASATSASNSAADAITAASDAQAAKNNAADSQTAAKQSEDNAADSATSAANSATSASDSATAAAESIKHAPRINADGKWELWDATKNAYVATEYTAIGEDGARGLGWYQFVVTTSNQQFYSWDGWPLAPKWGEGDWLYDPDNGNVGICTSRTDKADGSGFASITYKGTLKGADGTTPHIGENGNWYLGTTDTGKPSRGATGATGAKGEKGDTGAAGADGKSAYQYAQEGGYTGTETEFAEKLAQEQLTGTTDDLTPKQVYYAVSAGIPVKVQYFDETFGTLSYTNFSIAENMNMIAANCIVMFNSAYMLGELFGDKTNNIWSFITTILAEKADIPDIPTALPNPNALTIKIGGTTVTYDGSAEKTVTIADGSEVAY